MGGRGRTERPERGICALDLHSRITDEDVLDCQLPCLWPWAGDVCGCGGGRGDAEGEEEGIFQWPDALGADDGAGGECVCVEVRVGVCVGGRGVLDVGIGGEEVERRCEE